jgi:hypothetical protein
MPNIYDSFFHLFNLARAFFSLLPQLSVLKNSDKTLFRAALQYENRNPVTLILDCGIMWCYNCGKEVETFQQVVGSELHDFCVGCKCDITLQRRLVQYFRS